MTIGPTACSPRTSSSGCHGRRGPTIPHAQLERLRVDPLPRLRSGELVLARHADVVGVLRDPSFVKPDLPSIPIPSVRATMRNFLLLDGPDHTRLRRAVAPLFTPSAVQRRRDRIVERADRLLDGRRRARRHRGPRLSAPARDDRRRARCAPGRRGPHRRVGYGAARDPRQPHAAHRRRRAADGQGRRAAPVASGGADAGDPRDRGLRPSPAARRTIRPRRPTSSVPCRPGWPTGELTLDEAIGTWILIVIAGHETTANIIGTTLHLLARAPRAARARRRRPRPRRRAPCARRSGWRARSRTASGRPPRTRPSPGSPVAAGTTVHVLFGAANRDPGGLPRARSVRHPAGRDRATSPSGTAATSASGAQLAQLEAEVAVAQVLRRDPRLAPGARPPGGRRSRPEASPSCRSSSPGEIRALRCRRPRRWSDARGTDPSDDDAAKETAAASSSTSTTATVTVAGYTLLSSDDWTLVEAHDPLADDPGTAAETPPCRLVRGVRRHRQ